MLVFDKALSLQPGASGVLTVNNIKITDATASRNLLPNAMLNITDAVNIQFYKSGIATNSVSLFAIIEGIVTWRCGNNLDALPSFSVMASYGGLSTCTLVAPINFTLPTPTIMPTTPLLSGGQSSSGDSSNSMGVGIGIGAAILGGIIALACTLKLWLKRKRAPSRALVAETNTIKMMGNPLFKARRAEPMGSSSGTIGEFLQEPVSIDHDRLGSSPSNKRLSQMSRVSGWSDNYAHGDPSWSSAYATGNDDDSSHYYDRATGSHRPSFFGSRDSKGYEQGVAPDPRGTAPRLRKGEDYDA